MAQDELPQALTFDDVLLMPAESAVLPAEVNISTRLTSKIDLKIPIISLNNGHCNRSAMAIAMANPVESGYTQEYERRKSNLRKCKGQEVRVRLNPQPHNRVPRHDHSELREMKSKYGFSGFPVVNGGEGHNWNYHQ